MDSFSVRMQLPHVIQVHRKTGRAGRDPKFTQGQPPSLVIFQNAEAKLALVECLNLVTEPISGRKRPSSRFNRALTFQFMKKVDLIL